MHPDGKTYMNPCGTDAQMVKGKDIFTLKKGFRDYLFLWNPEISLHIEPSLNESENPLWGKTVPKYFCGFLIIQAHVWLNLILPFKNSIHRSKFSDSSLDLSEKSFNLPVRLRVLHPRYDMLDSIQFQEFFESMLSILPVSG